MELKGDLNKKAVFEQIENKITDKQFTVVDKDDQRPWGGFFVIEEIEADKFIDTFFPAHSIREFSGFTKLSPKILLVEPGKRLSWQYHHRRAELWRVIGGSAGVIISDTDEQGNVRTLKKGDEVKLKQGERHRLVGLDEWGVVAEIWKHTDPKKPSDEDDIVRVEDDFGR